MAREQLPPELPFDENSPLVEEHESQARIRAPPRSFSTWPYLFLSVFVIIANTVTTMLLTSPIAVISLFFIMRSPFSDLPIGGIEGERESRRASSANSSDKVYAFEALHAILSLINGQIWTVYVLLTKEEHVDPNPLEFEYDFLMMQRQPAVRRYLVYFTRVVLVFAVGFYLYPSLSS